MKLRIIICLFFLFPHLFGGAQPSGHHLTRDFTSTAILKGAGIGICVAELSSDRILLSEGKDLLLAPASTLKTVTTATALELLGPRYRFRTDFGYTGNIDKSNNKLDGDLVVRGGGDPTLGSTVMEGALSPEAIIKQLSQALKMAGIETISGDLVLDVSGYGPAETPGSWAWEDIGNYYGAAPSALTFADNLISLFFDSPSKAGEAVDLVRSEPELPWVTWQNELKSSSVNRDLAYVYGSPWGEKRVITGTIPAGQKEFLVKASMPEPPRYVGHFLAEKLTAEGIRILGSLKMISKKQEFVPLTTVWSPPLIDIITLINHESVNLFTEHLVMQLASEKSGAGSFQDGLNIISGFWKEKGFDGTVFMEDGSGLSRYDAVSAGFLVKVLRVMHGSVHGGIFKSSLPSAGNGTLGGFSTDDFPGESLRCKSGSMDRVRGYAGYLQCKSGREVAFAVLVNNYPGASQEVVGKIRELLKEIRNSY